MTAENESFRELARTETESRREFQRSKSEGEFSIDLIRDFHQVTISERDADFGGV